MRKEKLSRAKKK